MPMRIYPAIHYTMGGLWVDYNLMSNDSRAARARRSELLRPRRQPPRRQRADAGARRRLLRHPVHDRRLPGEQPAAEGHDRRRRVQGSGRPTRRSADRQAAVGQGHARHPRDPPRARHASCGTTSGWRAPRRACGARSRRSRSCATSSGTTCRCPGRPTTSIRASSTPGASPTTWSSPSCWRSTRCTGANRAAATSARRARRRTARRCATTSTTRTSRRGSSRASARQPELHKEPLVFEEVHPTQRSYK